MRRCAVLVFAGLDPSGGAGIAADIAAISAQGAHALPVVTTLTVQDHNRVHAVHPVDAALIERQAGALLDAIDIRAIKLGVPGSVANAEAIARVVARARERRPGLPVVLDPVLASGAGDRLAPDDARTALACLLPLATVATPNGPEYDALDWSGVPDVLRTGGHERGPAVINHWLRAEGGRAWSWPRLDGQFHGSGCTLAAALAARLAQDEPLEQAMTAAQMWCHRALAKSYSIAPGQRIPLRTGEAEVLQ